MLAHLKAAQEPNLLDTDVRGSQNVAAHLTVRHLKS